MLPVVVCLLLLSSAALAIEPPLTVGTPFSAAPNSSDSAVAPVRTDIDLSNPATATGNITSVHYYWSSAGCANAVKIKFYRRAGNTLTMTAERGPFTPSADNDISLTPAVAVQQGDLIGIARLTSCGNAGAFFGGAASDGYVAFPSDLSGPVDINTGSRNLSPLALSGSGTATEALEAIIPVVGRTQGGFGSNFRTPLQFFVASPLGFNGRFVFHPQGTSGSAADPSQSYSVGSGGIVDYSDIMDVLGQNGLGTIDVIAPAGVPPPIIATRVVNDAGANGTSGFIEDVVRMGTDVLSPHVLVLGSSGYLITPRSLTESRLNIGVRTLYSGATISVTVRDDHGNTVRTTTRTYQPNFFQQLDASTFVGGPIGASQSIQITVTSGSIIVYGATTDNITNDPAVKFADPAP